MLRSEDEVDVQEALVRLTFHSVDREWIESECIRLLDDPAISVGTKQLAITCIGHLARIHRTLNIETVIPVLMKVATNSALAGYVDNALDDIELFVTDETQN
ncbi:MAG: hypothetical protein AAFU54_24010 [Chloroflexota bacterium]